MIQTTVQTQIIMEMKITDIILWLGSSFYFRERWPFYFKFSLNDSSISLSVLRAYTSTRYALTITNFCVFHSLLERFYSILSEIVSLLFELYIFSAMT